jgi:hypothetical protein
VVEISVGMSRGMEQEKGARRWPYLGGPAGEVDDGLGAGRVDGLHDGADPGLHHGLVLFSRGTPFYQTRGEELRACLVCALFCPAKRWQELAAKILAKKSLAHT